MKRPAWWAAAAAVLGLTLPTGAVHGQAATQHAFVATLGADTFAVENVTRTAATLDAEITGGAFGRLVYSAELGAAGTITSMTLRAWPPGALPDAPPGQEVRITPGPDSVIVAITTAAGTQTQRLPSRAGALPYINPSFALTEQIVLRARAIGGDPVAVPIFMVQGGMTLDATVTTHAGDPTSVNLAGSVIRVMEDTAGNVTGMVLPAQNLRVTRIAGRHVAPLTLAPRDYSAPADAPYTAEDVRIETPMGHTLAGTFTRPRGGGRVPAVVTITGSGAQDRDQSLPILPGYQPMREIADVLGRAGIGVLRLDDRGYGASGGDFSSATSADFAEDVRAALAYLRSRPDVADDRLGLVGHSEGAMIAPMIAAADTLLAGIVLIAGPAQTGREIITFQQRWAVEHAADIPPAARDSVLAEAARQLEHAAATQPWVRFFLDHDPLAVAQRVRRTPVLILHGATDRQVTAEQAETLAAAFRTAGNPDVMVRVFEDINHLMIRDPSGDPAGYTQLDSAAVEREVLSVLADWIAARLR